MRVQFNNSKIPMQADLQIHIGDDFFYIQRNQLKDFLEKFNKNYETCLELQQIAKGLLLFCKPILDIYAIILKEFQKHGLDYTTISRNTGLTKKGVKKGVINGLVWNIHKLTKTTELKKVAEVQKHLIEQSIIRNFVIFILQPSNFIIVKKFPLFNFLCQDYNDQFYRISPPSIFKNLYNQLLSIVKQLNYNGGQTPSIQKVVIAVSDVQPAEKNYCFPIPVAKVYPDCKEEQQNAAFSEIAAGAMGKPNNLESDERLSQWKDKLSCHRAELERLKWIKPREASIVGELITNYLNIFCLKYLVGQI